MKKPFQDSVNTSVARTHSQPHKLVCNTSAIGKKLMGQSINSEKKINSVQIKCSWIMTDQGGGFIFTLLLSCETIHAIRWILD